MTSMPSESESGTFLEHSATTASLSSSKKSSSIRHAEKRRKSSGLFADRVAQISIDKYRYVVPHPEAMTCLSTLLAHDGTTNQLVVVALGVGTKFLSEDALRNEEQTALSIQSGTQEEENLCAYYGSRVRDSHAEVLCRRAFRRYLSNEMQQDIDTYNDDHEEAEHNDENSINSTGHSPSSIRLLERVPSHAVYNEEEIGNKSRSLSTETPDRISLHDMETQKSSHATSDASLATESALSDPPVLWRLRPGITLHAYSSSAPCGNSVLKKFADLRDNVQFRSDLSQDEWPSDHPHPIQLGHSVAQGQFALLVKHDRSSNPKESQDNDSTDTGDDKQHHCKPVKPHTRRFPTQLSPKQQKWPANQTTDWCPSGTTTVWSQQGSLHTCSDKLCRWNCLGWQGSLLSKYLVDPLYISTLTVGRKLSLAPCRRAVCCRACPSNTTLSWLPSPYRVHHPSILANAVYLDETAAVTVHHDKPGDDVRFHSTVCWVWWDGRTMAEAIDGSTGYRVHVNPTAMDSTMDISDASSPEGNIHTSFSAVCTLELVKAFLGVSNALATAKNEKMAPSSLVAPPRTLLELGELKQQESPHYQEAKRLLHSKHPVFRQWKQRGTNPIESEC